MQRTLLSFCGGALLALLSHASHAQSPLCTPAAPPWASNNGGTAGGVLFYDLNITNAVRITGFDCNLTAAVNTSVTLEVYTKSGSYVGFHTTPAAWTLSATAGPVLSSARESATSFTLASPLILTPGLTGIGYRVIGGGQAYNGTGTGAQVTTSNADMTLTSGAAISALFTGTFFTFRNWNGCIHYTLATGLFAAFTATPSSGATPLNVNFTDTTYTSDPNGVQTWAWDLDGDSIVDSNAPNPSFTYNTCGPYDVTLTVTDTLHPSSTLTRNDYIFADPQLVVGANFVGAPFAGVVPFNVQFTDISTGSPTSWSWDLDGDSIPDSAAQNPSFMYTTPGNYTVTLTTSNACFSDTETKVNYIMAVGAGTNLPADMLCYQMNEVRGARMANVATTTAFPAFGNLLNADWQRDPGAGRDFFDANETGFGCLSQRPTSTPTQNWVHTGRTFSHTGSLTVMWWARRDPSSTIASPFGYFFGDGGFRCFFGTAGILFGGGTGSPISATYTANHQGHLQHGVWHHFAVVIDNAAGRNLIYQDGVPHGTPRTFTPNTYTYTGTGQFAVGAISAAAGGSPSTLHYDIDDFRIYGSALSMGDIIASMGNEYASNGAFDPGCAGPGGIPVLSAAQRPTIPNPTYSLDATNLEPGRPASMVFGTLAHLSGFLPLDLSGILGAGCTLGVFPEISVPFFTGAGSVNVPVALPVDPSLNGFHGYIQVIVLGTSGAVSNALDANLQVD